MKLKNYNTVSDNIKAQINRVCEIWRNLLGDDLVGIYIHGSLALKCFCEEKSDIDFLIVTNRRISREERLSAARDIILIDGKPCQLEMSAILIKDLSPWHYPTVCQFHYSDYHTENYVKLLNGEINDYFIVDNDFEDSDIACHVKLTAQCGICVHGKPITEVFPDIPERDFIDSICSDIDGYDFNAYEPRYFTSNILILGRILSYFKNGYILSKYEAGLWTAQYVPDKYRYIIENALKVWYENGALEDYSSNDLDGLRELLISEIKQSVQAVNGGQNDN